MNAKQATLDFLNTLPDGAEFSGAQLAVRMNLQFDGYHFPGTYLRYMREYREKTGRKIVCINKRKSLYKIWSMERVT